MTTSTRERRDWTLLIFLIPIGIIFMLIAGQFAVRLFPIWRVKAGMQSKLDPDFLSGQQNLPMQPISQAILTPMGWLDTFLTPGAGSGDQIVFPPFVIFEPSATALVTRTPPPTVATTAIPVTALPTAVVPQPTSSNTPKPPVNTPVPPTTATTVVPPTTIVPTTAVPTTAVPTTVVPTTAVPTTAVPTTAVPTTAVPPTPGPGASTPVGTQVTTVPPGVNIGTPDGLAISMGNLSDGQYYVVDLGLDPNNQVNVNGTSDTGYDLVYYEMLNAAYVYMDRVIIGISQFSNGNFMYKVFDWGDNKPDTNSNLVCSTPCIEDDNQLVDPATLYGTPPLQTGIAIDVDNASSAPPIGLYQYIVLQAAGSGGSIDVDAIQILPDPPLPVSTMSSSPVDEALIPSVDEVPIPPADEIPIPPTDEPPVLPEATP